VVVDDGDVEGVTETSVCEEEGVYVMIHDGEHDEDDVEEVAIIVIVTQCYCCCSNFTSVCMYVSKRRQKLYKLCVRSLHFTSLHLLYKKNEREGE
jgi:hypothetical protein